MDGLNKAELPPHRAHSPMEFFLSFGIILFAYGGASTFPTIQNDMNEREKFSKSITIGFASEYLNSFLIYYYLFYGLK